MNAGAFGSTIGSLVEEVVAMDLEGNQYVRLGQNCNSPIAGATSRRKS